MAEQRAKEFYKKDFRFKEHYDSVERYFVKFLADNKYNTKNEKQSLNR
jgi:hypothetical protein